MDEIKSIKYPFKTTMREFCKFLEKREIDVDPISITDDETGSTIVYKNVSVDEKLKNLFGAYNTPIDKNRLYNYPKEPTKFDILLYNRIGSRTLVEKNIGRYWNFIFNDDKILIKLVAGVSTIFYRTTSNEVGGELEDDESLNLKFFCPKNRWEFDAIFIGYIFDECKRSDNVILCASHFYDLEAGEEIPYHNNGDTIAWKLTDK